MTKLVTTNCERLLLDAPALPQNWNLAYAVTQARRAAFLSDASHSDSFFKPTSETAMTVFMLGRLEGWAQAQTAVDGKQGSTPRTSRGVWSPAFFRRFATPWSSPLPRTSALGEFLAQRLALDEKEMTDPFLLFEVRTFNNAFNGGKTIRNPSFSIVPGEWSRFDALVILPVAQTLVFVESKVNSDGTHGAAGHDVSQPIRNLETAFFLTTLPESQYCGWSFRYVLLCPRHSTGTDKECELFFSDGHESALNAYDQYLSDPTAPLRASAKRVEYRAQWQTLRQKLKAHLSVFHWSDLLEALCRQGFDPKKYFEQLAPITKHDNTLIKATQQRWLAAGLPAAWNE